MLSLVSVSLLGSLFACRPPPEAPAELGKLSEYLYLHQADEDIDAPIAGIRNLEACFDAFEDCFPDEADQYVDFPSLELDTPFGLRSWTLEPLSEEAVAGLPKRPDRPLENLLGSAVGYVSKQSIDCHAAVQGLPDQLPVEPTAETYERLFPDDGAPSCFVDGSCETMVTVNDARRSNFLFGADFLLYKDFRWLDLEDEDGTPRRAFYSRSWFDQSWETDDGPGGNQLWQSYSVDVWMERDDGTTARYQAVWSESDVFLGVVQIGGNEQLATVAGAAEGIFTTTDQYITDTLIPDGTCQ